ncbi:hypothetical protein OF897_07465 [Chryseobacterium formosus]|uniref:Uncharacterized protein n=1 Tax=Chryseobacterium formosus TaxID=1537363 RepID=A0ABT3XNR9_9FLAO|nr:hypothetical protein [Chryseobacterium formosus]MCX8523760.1 hypothetical protein [Chryseobacterium formosus]
MKRFLLGLLVFINLNGQLKNNNINECYDGQTTDFQEFKKVYQNIVVDDYKKILTENNDQSQNEFEIILFERGDNSKGSLAVFNVNGDQIFGYNKNITNVHYLNIKKEDILELTKNLAFIKNNFYGETCMKLQHNKINTLIIKKKGMIISGYVSYNSSKLKTSENSKDLIALKKILSIVYQNSFQK